MPLLSPQGMYPNSMGTRNGSPWKEEPKVESLTWQQVL